MLLMFTSVVRRATPAVNGASLTSVFVLKTGGNAGWHQASKNPDRTRVRNPFTEKGHELASRVLKESRKDGCGVTFSLEKLTLVENSIRGRKDSDQVMIRPRFSSVTLVTSSRKT